MARIEEVKEECPTCKGAGVLPLPGGRPEEAVVCMPCDGNGWRALKVRVFDGRPPRRPGVKVIRRSMGACPPIDVERTGWLMTYDEFDTFFPAEARK